MLLYSTDAYPPVPVPCSQPALGAAGFVAAIRTSNDEPIPRPLALSFRTPDSRQPEFLADIERLCREIDLVARLVERDREVVGLHVEIAEADAPWRLARFSDQIDALRHQFHFSTAATSEMTIHADPRVLRPGEIATLAAAGFNRIAFTTGQLDPLVVRTCRSSGFRSIAVTVGDEPAAATAESIEARVDAALALRPDRLMVRARSDDGLWHVAERIHGNLTLAGFVCIGPEHYALPDDDLTTALRAGRLFYGPYGYAPDTDCDWLGFGPGAVSHVGDRHFRNVAKSAQWRHDVDAGCLPVRSGWRAGADESLRSELIQQLLCQRRLAIRELERAHGIEFRRYFAQELDRLESWVAAGFATDLGDRIEVGSRGLPWLRKMAACFEIRVEETPARRSVQAR